MLELEDIFGHGGPLERALSGFKVRREQLRMAERVGGALTAREPLVVEAGTGTGKTFAYLVPALLSGARVLISTGTRTLQDQLFTKDLPLVAARHRPPGARGAAQGARQLPVPLPPGSVPSRRVEQLTLMETEAPRGGASRSMLARIQRWSRTTARGDLAEVRGLSDTHPVWAPGHLDARELPRRALPGDRAMSRGARAPCGTRSRHRDRQPSPAAGGSGAQGGRVRRPARLGRCRHPR